MERQPVVVSLEMEAGYRFTVEFGEGIPPLTMDEPEPLGGGSGPDASRLLAAAVGNCLSASALFCLRKARIEVTGMRTTVRAPVVRNDDGRLRIGRVEVELRPEVAEADLDRVGRCLDLFEDFCIVTQSVRDGLDVRVEVAPVAAGEQVVG